MQKTIRPGLESETKTERITVIFNNHEMDLYYTSKSSTPIPTGVSLTVIMPC